MFRFTQRKSTSRRRRRRRHSLCGTASWWLAGRGLSPVASRDRQVRFTSDSRIPWPNAETRGVAPSETGETLRKERGKIKNKMTSTIRPNRKGESKRELLDFHGRVVSLRRHRRRRGSVVCSTFSIAPRHHRRIPRFPEQRQPAANASEVTTARPIPSGNKST